MKSLIVHNLLDPSSLSQVVENHTADALPNGSNRCAFSVSSPPFFFTTPAIKGQYYLLTLGSKFYSAIGLKSNAPNSNSAVLLYLKEL